MRSVAEIRKTFCLQTLHHDCGAACINSILGYFNLGKIDALEFIKNKEGINLLSLKNILVAQGIEVGAYECKQLPKQNELAMIVVKNQGENHAVLLYPHQKRDGEVEYVLVGNPASGVYWQEKEGFIWEGIMMTFKYRNTFSSLRPILLDVFASQYQTYKKHVLNFNVVIFWGLVVNILTILLPIIFQSALDYFKLNRDLESISRYVLLICFILFIRAGISYLRKNLIADFARNYYSENIKTWFNDLANSRSSFWATLNHGDFNKLLKEQHQLQQLNLLSLIEIISDVLQLILFIGLTFYYSVFVGGLLLLFVLINQAYIFYHAEVLGQEQENLKTAQAHAEQSFMACCSQFDALKADGFDISLNTPVLKHFNRLYERIRNYGLFQNRLQLVNDMISNFIYVFGLFIILYQYCQQTITLAQMLTLIGLVYYSLPIIVKVTNSIKFYYEQVPNFGKQKIIKQIGKIEKDKIKVFNSCRIINGRHLYLTHPINIEINEGDFILLKGGNGVGKSSLLNLIAGNLTLSTGSLIINDEIVQNDYTICGLSLLKQDVPIFDGTLQYNITLNNGLAHDFETFIALFSLGNFLKQFEHQEQTNLSYSQENLSGGQKKILGLARALYQKPKLLLLDEPELGLDKNNLKWLIAILPLINQRTTIVVCSHSELYDEMVNKEIELS
jgi:ABC-type bacteriocin/lantibiotic exporter with double-glycine peptidase domain